jgi:hypothetical protein
MSPVGLLHALNIGLGKDLWHAVIEWVKFYAPEGKAKELLERIDQYARSLAKHPGRKPISQVC